MEFYLKRPKKKNLAQSSKKDVKAMMKVFIYELFPLKTLGIDIIQVFLKIETTLVLKGWPGHLFLATLEKPLGHQLVAS